MVYIVQGKIIFERPAFDAKLVEGKGSLDGAVQNESDRIARKVITQTLENQFKNVGLSNVTATVKVAQKFELNFGEMKILLPKQGWEEYLTQKYCSKEGYSDKGWEAAEGEILLYKETRIPLPWIYFFSNGNLVEQFYVGKGQVCLRRNKTRKESSRFAGLFFGLHNFGNPKGLKFYEQKRTQIAKGFSFK